MHLDRSRVNPAEFVRHGWRLALALAIASGFCGCAAPTVSIPRPASPFAPSTAPVEVVPVVVPAQPEQPPPQVSVLETMLAFADRVRGMQPAELTQEISRLGDGSDSATRLMQLVIALAQSKVASNTQRAQALLQRVLGSNEPDARALHPLARLMAPQLAETRRADEQAERQAQQLRDAQRRIDVLNERLEAVRAIERSLPSSPGSGASAPAPSRP
jgi:hypothetical protein